MNDECDNCGGEPYAVHPTPENEPWFRELLRECPPVSEDWAYVDGIEEALLAAQAQKD